MTNDEFRQKWNETVRRSDLGPYDFERLAEMVVEYRRKAASLNTLKTVLLRSAITRAFRLIRTI